MAWSRAKQEVTPSYTIKKKEVQVKQKKRLRVLAGGEIAQIHN
jgi:hypothetical protein